MRSPYTRAKWIALLPLRNLIICDTAHLGGLAINMCMCSGIRCPSSIQLSFLQRQMPEYFPPDVTSVRNATRESLQPVGPGWSGERLLDFRLVLHRHLAENVSWSKGDRILVESSSRLSVCHIVSGDRWAGAEAQVATLIRNLAQCRDLQLSAIVLNPGRLAQELRGCNIEVTIIPEATYGFFATAKRAAHHLGRHRVQILHSHRYKENILAYLLRYRCSAPVLVRTQHGLPEPFAGFRQVKQAALHVLDGFVARHGTNRIISVSTELVPRLAHRYGAGKVTTIPNGVDTALVHSDLSAAEAKARLGIRDTDFLIGTVGRAEPVKRFDVFLKAAQALRQNLPNAFFAIVGDGTELPRLQALADDLGLTDKVHFLGHRDDVYDVLRAFDVFVMCSAHEGLPMALLEALYLGVPTVACPVGGICDVVEHGVSGILVDPCDPQHLARACEDVLCTPELRAKIAAGGRARVASQFTGATTASEVLQLYRSLVRR